MTLNTIHQGDCLELMKDIKDGTIDMILCDLPYGSTQCKWDTIIPFDKLWEQYNRIIKDNGAIVLTASQPFTSNLVMSNPKIFKYSWVWEKSKATGHLNAKKMPMKKHEDICVFYKKQCTYNPQGTIVGEFNTFRPAKAKKNEDVYGDQKEYGKSSVGNYPKSVIKIDNPSGKGNLHPTQKPVELMEYLIKTYTNEGEIVLDNCIGSGTTAIAAINTNRNWIGMEMEEKYVELANKRIEDHINNIK